VKDLHDNCLTVRNPSQADCDGTGPGNACSPDFDADGLPNACAVAGGAADVNSNGVPDSCECPTDIDGNGTVDGTDVSLVLGSWGACP
jgi:hypothetical protein